MWPLTVQQQRSMKKMQTLSPKMKALQDRYKSQPQVLQQKMMEFYKENEFVNEYIWPGSSNQVLHILGALFKQRAQIAKLKLELARKAKNHAEIHRFKLEFNKARSVFCDLLSNGWVD